MNVKELKETLANYPDDMLVVMSSDEEGNGFNELYDVAESMWFDHGYGDGQTYVLDKYIGTLGYTEEDRAPSGAVPALVLWP